MKKYEASGSFEENPVPRPHPQSHQSVLTIGGGPIILLLLDRIALAAFAAAAYLSPAERKEGGRGIRVSFTSFLLCNFHMAP